VDKVDKRGMKPMTSFFQVKKKAKVDEPKKKEE
jgi:hypothetical protein